MRFYPAKIHLVFIIFVLTSIGLNLGCSKDTDLLRDAVLIESVSSVERKESEVNETPDPVIEGPEEETSEVTVADAFENRTTNFPPLHDAHVQSGKGYNQNIIRLEEGNRTSYIMFDLSQIEAVGGTITDATLEFTIAIDDGSGTINISRGISNDWTEGTLSDDNAPQIDIQLGTVAKEFSIGQTEAVALNTANMIAEKSTLILEHQNGNDLAFASKEHASKIGPRLVVSYDVPIGTEEIVIPVIEETVEESNEEADSTNQEPMAVADASPSAGGVPLEVTFLGGNSTDDNEIISYSWDFKDGSVSTEANPVHTFSQTGVYEAELTVTDAEGLTNVDKVSITVTEDQNQAPIANVSATPISGDAPLEVSFKGSSSTDDHSIASYGWDFQDGSKTNIADFTYTYTSPGTYEAELTVSDENGLSDKETITITVTEPQNNAPIAVVGADITSGTGPLQVQFSGSNSTDDKGVTSYYWDFKNGSTSTAVNPINTFNQAGSYQVELTVKDAEGLTNKKSITITVTASSNQAPVAVSTPSVTSGEAPLTVNFNGNKSTDDNGIISYLWNFKDGSTSTEANPSHTFQNPGTYQVELLVTDADGATDTDTDTITVSAPSNNVPTGYYVATNGSSGNSGNSPSSPWSLEHAFSVAKAGDLIYVKAGNYGNKNLINYTSGFSGTPIKFIGYTNAPGDLVSNQGSTFTYGESLNSTKMPLLSGSSPLTGLALDINGSFVEVHNFQITNYQAGVHTKGRNITLKNVIVTNNGEQNNNNSQTGRGFQIFGDNAILQDCFNLNSNAEGINIKGANNCTIKNTKVYSDNHSNPGGYYIAITFGGSNNVIEDCLIYRSKTADLHRGHGYIMKDQATNNIVRRSTAYNTGIEVNFSGVSYNTFDDVKLYGSHSEDSSEYSSGIRVINGAHHNTFKNIYIKDSRYPFNFHDFNDGFVGPGGDRDLAQGGNYNEFISVVSEGSNSVVFCNTVDTPLGQSTSIGNTWTNCTFSNVSSVPFYTTHQTSNFKFTGCTFNNISGTNLSQTENGIGSWNASYPNSTFMNVSFPIPPN